jgi:hypothetical protein
MAAGTPLFATSLNGVAYNATGATKTGTAANAVGPCDNVSMVATVGSYAGAGAITVHLQVSHDNTNWVTADSVSFEGNGTRPIKASDFPAVQARAVLSSVGSGVTAGSVTASVALA